MINFLSILSYRSCSKLSYEKVYWVQWIQEPKHEVICYKFPDDILKIWNMDKIVAPYIPLHLVCSWFKPWNTSQNQVSWSQTKTKPCTGIHRYANRNELYMVRLHSSFVQVLQFQKFWPIISLMKVKTSLGL